MPESPDDAKSRGERTSNKYAAKKAASERIAGARAAQARAARRRNVLYAGGATVLVLVVIAVIVAVGLTHKTKTSAGNPVVPATTTVMQGITKAAADTSAVSTFAAVTGPPSRLTGAALTGTSGKPKVLYIGAGYCPFCAITRWPLTVALSRFGTFTNLQTTSSSATDTNPNTPTLSYYGTHYTSDYIDFVHYEVEGGVQGQALETPTDADTKLWTGLGKGYFPFVDFGGKWMQSQASADGSVLAGLTPESVATQIADSTTKIGSNVQQGADVYTSIICGIDGGKPANVCTAPGVITATTALSSLK